MRMPARRPATYDDIVALPEHQVGEIVDGEVFVSPRPAGPHALGNSALGATLVTRMQFGDGGPGGWWILDEPELHFAEDVVVPDMAGWKRERLPERPQDVFFTLAPDWVCEVLSPSTSRFDRTRKLPVCARAGIPHLWLLDPLAETLEVYRLQSEHWVLLATHGGDDVVNAEPSEAATVNLKRIWGRQQMSSVAPRRATYADLLALPRSLVGEIIGGELRTQPRPGGPHAAAASILGMVLGNPFHRGSGGPGGSVILDEPELHLGLDLLVPDLAGWRRERTPRVPDAAAFELSPDQVAEILSPSTAAVDRADKLPIYTREHVSHVWLLDPRLQTLEALALDSGAYRLLGAWRGDARAHIPPFDALELELSAL